MPPTTGKRRRASSSSSVDEKNKKKKKQQDLKDKSISQNECNVADTSSNSKQPSPKQVICRPLSIRHASLKASLLLKPKTSKSKPKFKAKSKRTKTTTMTPAMKGSANINILPNEILFLIFGNLQQPSLNELLQRSSTCSRWNQVTIAMFRFIRRIHLIITPQHEDEEEDVFDLSYLIEQMPLPNGKDSQTLILRENLFTRKVARRLAYLFENLNEVEVIWKASSKQAERSLYKLLSKHTHQLTSLTFLCSRNSSVSNSLLAHLLMTPFTVNKRFQLFLPPNEEFSSVLMSTRTLVQNLDTLTALSVTNWSFHGPVEYLYFLHSCGCSHRPVPLLELGLAFYPLYAENVDNIFADSPRLADLRYLRLSFPIVFDSLLKEGPAFGSLATFLSHFTSLSELCLLGNNLKDYDHLLHLGEEDEADVHLTDFLVFDNRWATAVRGCPSFPQLSRLTLGNFILPRKKKRTAEGDAVFSLPHIRELHIYGTDLFLGYWTKKMFVVKRGFDGDRFCKILASLFPNLEQLQMSTDQESNKQVKLTLSQIEAILKKVSPKYLPKLKEVLIRKVTAADSRDLFSKRNV